MTGFRRRIPSMTALLTLEAASRLRSFTAAALELGVTQAAVSRQVLALEQELGVLLFLRKHRSIEPTPDCLKLCATLANSFSDIAETIAAIRSSDSDVVTIGATVAFSSFWLLPRLAEFRNEHPDVQLRVVSQDTRFDLASGGADVVIAYANPPFIDAVAIASKEDSIFPVCSPDYMRKRKAGGLSGADVFIETNVQDRSWLSWDDWLERTGQTIAIRPHLQFSHYTETIAAARAGQGVALGWRLLVQTFLEDGTLMAFDEVAMPSAKQYHVLVRTKNRRSSTAEKAADWFARALTA